MPGIACAGNWIIDQVKLIDTWPKEGELANIVSQTQGPGGSPFNLLVDFAHMQVPFPTYGVGCIGDDLIGKQILSICESETINTQWITTLQNEFSSFTDVMTVESSGARTFFHCRGANAAFSPEHVPVDALVKSDVRIFMLGYLLLLDQFDVLNDDGTTAASVLLSQLRAKGVKTAIDVVSEASDRFAEVVKPSLPHVDYLIINEVEAGNILGRDLRKQDQLDEQATSEAAGELLELGVQDTVVIHYPEGATWVSASGERLQQASLTVPSSDIVGSVGAGDAFCAGTLWGLHEGWSPADTITMASGMAAACLTEANTTDGVKNSDYVQSIIKKYS